MTEPDVTGGVVVVTMPQMGETVTEGTVTAWLKAPGDAVADDEPLLEISTDKVDSDVPAPADGVLDEILVAEGETVAIGTPLARIRSSLAGSSVGAEGPARAIVGSGSRSRGQDPEIGSQNGGGERLAGDGRFRSPVVRRLAAAHDLDLAGVEGSGAGGRVTRDDVLALVAAAPADRDRPGVRHVAFTAMRRTIGEHMVRSLATSAHTLVATEIDFQAAATAKEQASLTWLPFIARAVIDALAAHPVLNGRVAGDGVDVHEHVDLGLAVDLDFEGLVVPVVRSADRLRLQALAEVMAERARAARAGTLLPDDFAGGTFTLTNAGRYGTLLTVPIINQPQVAILSTDGVKVRPVAVAQGDGGHALAFHPVGNLALSFDHRVVDGAYAASFLADVRTRLESADWMAELGGGAP